MTYLYAIVAYGVLMLLGKVAYTRLTAPEKKETPVLFNWNFNFIQLRQALMSVWF